ncbi:MAG: gas vesicle accessory protein GvpU [Synechococcales bacterium]|nr:gas vesicle accessory protein GvpU [Synechococcales bacterium]
MVDQRRDHDDQVASASTSAVGCDRLLQALVAIPEKTSIQLSLTLNVSGLIVSGQLISRQTYFKRLAHMIQDSDASDIVKDSLDEFIGQVGHEIEGDEIHSNGVALPTFIHLKNAQMYPSNGRGMPSNTDALWRGRISEVSGFSFGAISHSNYPERIGDHLVVG